MPLPKLSIPEYELEMPITGKKVSYRPFLVKEEKLLYLAMESQDNKQMVKAVKTIIKNCTDLKSNVTNSLLSRLNTSSFVLEQKQLVKLVNLKSHAPDDEKTSIPVQIPLEEVEVQVPDGHDKKILLMTKLVL